MPKRMVDTEKYRKPFIRALPGPYKLLWDYICLDCDHAGIWIVDFEIAQIYIGADAPVDAKTAIDLFNRDEVRIQEIDGGKKWFILPFIFFQYGELNPLNRVHKSVLNILKTHFLEAPTKGHSKPLDMPLPRGKQGCKDKDKDKDKDEKKTKRGVFEKPSPEEVSEFADSIDFELDGEEFCDFYESKGWMVGKNKMKCWKSAVRTWKRRQKPDLVNQATRAADEDEIDNLLGFGK